MTTEEILTERRENLRKDNRDYHRKLADNAVRSANETEANIRYFLLAFAIFLFTFSPVGVLENNTQIDLNRAQSIWIFLSLSLVSGAIHIDADLKFFVNNLRLHNDCEEIWVRHSYPSEQKFKKMEEDSKKLLKKETTESNRYPLILQAVFVIIAFAMILGLYWSQDTSLGSEITNSCHCSHNHHPTVNLPKSQDGYIRHR